MMFCTLLFVSDDLILDVCVIFAILQALGRCSISPVVLDEILNGLDIVSTVVGEFFRGAPILLYMWLLERFWFISTN